MFPAKLPIIAKAPAFNKYSASFTGSNERINIGTSNALEPNNVSVSAWLNLQSESGIQYFVNKNYSTSHGAYSLLQHTSGGANVRFLAYTDTTYVSPSFSVSGLTDTWIHVVGTYDGDFVRLYKNGVQVGSGTDTSESGNLTYGYSQTFTIGHYRDSLYANAMIDEVGVFNTALPLADIVSMYNNGEPNDLRNSISYDTNRTSNLIGYWRFEEGGGTNVADSSTNSNNGTLVNYPTFSEEVPT